MNSLNPTSYAISTSEGPIAISDSRSNDTPDYPAVIFVHGHCTNRTFFSQQIKSPHFADYRIICLDLPGYGESPPPKNPERIYSFPGFAGVVRELVNILQLKSIVIVGWSLGGHIALELTSMLPQLKGIVLTGAPPIEISPKGFSQGFRAANPKLLGCFGKGNLSEEEAGLAATISGYDYSKEKRFIVDAILETDEGAKTMYPRSVVNGVGQNELAIVKEWPHPICVIVGENDAVVNNDYILHDVTFRNLWKNKVFIIPKTGHAVQLEQPETFNTILRNFFHDIFKRSH